MSRESLMSKKGITVFAVAVFGVFVLSLLFYNHFASAIDINTLKQVNPCAAKAINPCAVKTLNPCAAKTLNPCAAKTLNPCAAKTLNPCAAKT